MSRCRAALCAVIASLLTFSTGGSAAAQNVTTLRSWMFNYCQSFPFYDWTVPPIDAPPPQVISACIAGTASFGFHPSVGLYGLSYNFSPVTYSQPIPAGDFFDAKMCGFEALYGAGKFAEVGDIIAPGCQPLTSGEFFRTSNTDYFSPDPPARLFVTGVFFPGGLGTLNCCTDWNSPTVEGTTMPEPGTLALLGTGLLPGLLWRRRRRSRR